MDLLLITEDGKKFYVLIKDFDKFMYNQSKHKERKHFCMYCLQSFSSESISAKHTNNCLTMNGKQAINMPKKGENVPTQVGTLTQVVTSVHLGRPTSTPIFLLTHLMPFSTRLETSISK